MPSPENPNSDPQAGIAPGSSASGDAPVPESASGYTVSPFPPLVRPDPVWSGWDVLLIALLTIVTLAVTELLTIIAAWILVYPHSRFAELVQKPALSVIGEFLAYLAIAAYMIMLVEGKYHVRFWQAIHWNWRTTATPKLLGLGVLTVGLDFLARYLPMPKTTPFDQMFSRPSDAYLIAIFAVSLGPFMEELFFRGFLYPVLERRTGRFLAILLTALPFGLMHYVQYRSWGAVLVITLVGVVLTLVRAVTNSVAASFLVHVGYNATLMTLTALATDGFRHMQKLGTAT